MTDSKETCHAESRLSAGLGADPEIRYTPSGAAVANFRIAVNEFWTDQGGEKKERAHWLPCVAWKHLAEILNQYLSKGSQVGISGSLRQRTWQTDSGENRSIVEILARDLIPPIGGTGPQTPERCAGPG